jgi:hypothetical protein
VSSLVVVGLSVALVGLSEEVAVSGKGTRRLSLKDLLITGAGPFALYRLLDIIPKASLTCTDASKHMLATTTNIKDTPVSLFNILLGYVYINNTR